MDLKQLKAILKVMRENGVTSLKTADLDLQVIPEFMIQPKQQPQVVGKSAIPTENPYSDFPDGELTPEQLMFYSSGGDPKEDPYRTDGENS